MPHDLAERVLPRFLVLHVGACLDAGNLGGKPPRGSQQEMARSAGRIKHPEIENRGARVIRPVGDGPCDDRVESCLHEFAHQTGRSVVRAAELSR